MEKEQILSTLTAKLGKTSFSSRSLDAYVSANLPAEGTEPDDAYFETHVNVLKSFGGQYSHDLATAIEDFKKNYKPTTTSPAPTTPSADGELAKALERIGALESAITKKDEILIVDNIRKSILGKAEELKISNYKNEWEDAVNSIPLTKETSDADALAKAKEKFESLVKRYHGDSAKPYGKGEKTPKFTADEAKKRREAYLAKLKSSGKIPSSYK